MNINFDKIKFYDIFGANEFKSKYRIGDCVVIEGIDEKLVIGEITFNPIVGITYTCISEDDIIPAQAEHLKLHKEVKDEGTNKSD